MITLALEGCCKHDEKWDIQPIIEMPTGRASRTLKDIIDSHHKAFSFSNAPREMQQYLCKYFGARAGGMDVEKESQPSIDRRTTEVDKAGSEVTFAHPMSPRFAPASTDDDSSPPSSSNASAYTAPPTTPVDIEEQQEYFASKHRIWSERVREQRELIKTLCNVPGANRIVAAAASSTKDGEGRCLDPLFDHGLNDGATMLFCDVHKTIVGGEHADDETQTSWERVQRQRRKDSIIDAVISLDSHVSQANKFKQAILQSYAQASTSDLHTRLLTIETFDYQYGRGDYVDETLEVSGYDIEKLTSATGWERRWKRLNSATGGAALERPSYVPVSMHESTFGASSIKETLVSASAEHKRTPALMGGQRLQRAMQHILSSSNHDDKASSQTAELPEYLGTGWGARLAKPSQSATNRVRLSMRCGLRSDRR